jgi:hypothetical protein
MCERGEFRAREPGRMVPLLGDVIAAARATAGCWLSSGECLQLAASHFIDTWKEPPEGAQHAA